MARTPFFAGADTAPTQREGARKVALRLAPDHPDLGFNVLYSAASYLIRDGRAPKDSVVLAEARRRMKMVHDAIESHRRRNKKAAA